MDDSISSTRNFVMSMYYLLGGGHSKLLLTSVERTNGSNDSDGEALGA